MGPEGTTNRVEKVGFSFLTDDEIRSSSWVKITSPDLLLAPPGSPLPVPVPGGLYDPALGPLYDSFQSCCKTCGQTSKNCPGHFGHIELVSTVYNPLMFNILSKILQKTCFSCHHFQASRTEVEKCTSQLEFISKGDIIRAKNLDSTSPDESIYLGDADESPCCSSGPPGENWTSLQFSEAMSVLRKFLAPKYKKCKNCGRVSPRISKPTFGWFHVALSAAQARQNFIRSDGASLASKSISDNISLGNGDTTDEEAHNREKRKSSYKLAEQSMLSGSLLPSQVKDIFELLWENEARLCSHISDIQDQGFGKKAGHSMFFLENIFVPPIKFRPPTKGGDNVMEHPQTVLLQKVLKSNISLRDAHLKKEDPSKVQKCWVDLQQSVNMLYDNKTASGQRDVATGICQLLEKKEGIFRQKMMGKRVNFACRSVISPDPYLAVNEIGIPPYFALRLTYPERVTPWNVVNLRNAILNGPESHPGATLYADKVSMVMLKKDSLSSTSRKLPSSRGVIMNHGEIHDHEFEGKVVYRHLRDGDVVLVNRQPTLHKPSIMAHIVRVLKGEKTVRMHYANCGTYNADFDGDEINVHFPQDEISRAEAYNIVNANNQYVKPTSGDPIRALIQDHIVSAALLTKKDTFLTYEEFNQLLYSSGVSMAGLGSFFGKPGQKVFMSKSESEMFLFPPAVWKPEPLWTGKQVISALLHYITRGCPPFTVEKNAKIPSSFFKTRNREGKKCTKDTSRKEEELDEDKLLIYRNDLVRGVVDKAQFGDYGMVHTVQELYGSNTAGNLLTALSRLFTTYLQMHGFTCGVDDLLLIDGKDGERKNQLESCEEIGDIVHREFIGVMDGDSIDPITMQLDIEKRIRSNGEAAVTYLDRKMISNLNSRTSSGILKVLLSEGILKPSGKNCISLMTTSGAKGSMVNFQQISSHLGQQELEGKRVPRMVSGKTLPCFTPWDCSPRAGGFIIDRFLTALRPQEYYFHCMAGREGLVDTAVKTSRSGYLQRCLMKNLECLQVCYDHTVRDSDSSIIQFHYGEDGVDVHQTSFITKFEALSTNKELVYSNCCRQLDRSSPYINKLPDALKEKAENFIRDFSLKHRNSCSLKRADFLKLMEHKYISSLAQPGEPVGVLASQSVGEPATQMTLNTFHLAGRGEMNVTLGIPRLGEIIMLAAHDIKTPFMTCPLRPNKSPEDANCLADKLKKITVADIIESMKVSVVPIAVRDGKVCSIYKLVLKLYKPKHYPKYTDITLEDWKETLSVVFVRELEDAIQNHMTLLSKIRGIKDVRSNESESEKKGITNEDDDDDVEDKEGSEALGSDAQKRKQRQTKEDDDDDVEDTEESEDLGLDAQKRKQQGTDEFDYEDGAEEETHDGELSEELEGDEDGNDIEVNEDDKNVTHNANKSQELEGDEDGSDIEVNEDDKNVTHDANNSQGLKTHSKRKSIDEKASLKSKKKKSELTIKETDRAVYVKAKGKKFEIRFKFVNEPHILLAQIAQRTAKKVCIQKFGKVGQCKAITCKESGVIYYGEDVSKRNDIPSSVKEKIPALQTSGVHFETFWDMQDDLDVRYVYTNNVHAMLNTYGVEAARETIIREIQNVFKSYGISVNIRHLTLIADFMTHSGSYRPMSRIGSIANSTSPFLKMCFETASKFIVEAAYHGQVDNLETPSSRICLGLPVKMGTGCHDLIQKLEL
ncbi:DNA-directed RNA polymerase I subunit 1 isoform X2 [Lotus japonicus]|uniref:DNA-directed RNA polymerase I subunit 1 isoform X2 n=1 Tax=Lotus japonicus TaxID=34305 RepID=UPI0025905075|nr:DNA-directed RNA polymerase I subunit 1 isoform X2 [Lotus japonicus]